MVQNSSFSVSVILSTPSIHPPNQKDKTTLSLSLSLSLSKSFAFSFHQSLPPPLPLYTSIMADTETPLKRPREEEEIMEETKRQRSYNDILSILEEEEEEPYQDDLSSLITTLQQELSSTSSSSFQTRPSQEEEEDEDSSDHPLLPETTTINPSEPGPINTSSSTDSINEPNSLSSSTSSSPLLFKDYEEIRHLLEASDDELGIPQTQIRLGDQEYEDVIHASGEGGSGISLFGVNGDGLWDFEDVTANYYTLLQSELFM